MMHKQLLYIVLFSLSLVIILNGCSLYNDYSRNNDYNRSPSMTMENKSSNIYIPNGIINKDIISESDICGSSKGTDCEYKKWIYNSLRERQNGNG